MIYYISTDFILLIVKNGEALPELHLFLTIKYNNSENIKLLFTKWRHKFFNWFFWSGPFNGFQVQKKIN